MFCSFSTSSGFSESFCITFLGSFKSESVRPNSDFTFSNSVANCSGDLVATAFSTSEKISGNCDFTDCNSEDIPPDSGEKLSKVLIYFIYSILFFIIYSIWKLIFLIF